MNSKGKFREWCEDNGGQYGDGTIAAGVADLCFFKDATIKRTNYGRIQMGTGEHRKETRLAVEYDELEISGSSLITKKNGERTGKLLGGPKRRPLGEPKR